MKNTHPERPVILYIAMSLDGYIAKPNDDLQFLEIVHQEGEDYGYNEFVSGVDTVILGRKTYDWVTRQFEFPHKEKEAYIITRTARPNQGKTVFYTGSLTTLIEKLKKESGKSIFCDGGAELVTELLKHDLIDEFIISVIPILVGHGTRLFKDGRPEQKLTLVKSTSYESGLTQLHYRRLRTDG